MLRWVINICDQNKTANCPPERRKIKTKKKNTYNEKAEIGVRADCLHDLTPDLSSIPAVVVPPWPKSVCWYNASGRVETAERYKLIEDGLGVYMIEVKPSESCDAGEWKCVVTSFDGSMGISTCSVAMDSEWSGMISFY